VVKADGYGCGAGRVARALADAGARTFFVAVAEEAAALRAALGPGPVINVFSGHMDADTQVLADLNAIPMLNSPEQIARHRDRLPGHAFGLQLNTGMNRLGLSAYDWDPTMSVDATLVMSHLACADAPGHQGNADQLRAFLEMTAGILAPRSLAAYGGLPFEGAAPVVGLELPVIQTRKIAKGEPVGYGHSFIAERDSVIATVSAGYADGLIRAMSGKAVLYAGDTPCPLAGRVSMDLLTVDVTDLDVVPEALSILGPQQTVDQLADAAGTIGYEILTSLGARYNRRYLSA